MSWWDPSSIAVDPAREPDPRTFILATRHLQPILVPRAMLFQPWRDGAPRPRVRIRVDAVRVAEITDPRWRRGQISARRRRGIRRAIRRGWVARRHGVITHVRA
jgi:hypothetical protein